MCQTWFARFRWDMTLEDGERSGRPAIGDNDKINVLETNLYDTTNCKNTKNINNGID